MRQWMLAVGAALVLLGCMHVPSAEDPFAKSMYADMVYLSDAKTARISSWDRSGANVDMRAIAAGETLELAAIEGAGSIRHIYFTIIKSAPSDLRYFQDLVLRMYWDGETEPSVEVPIGEFFGQGNGKINLFRSQMVTVNTGAISDASDVPLSIGMNSYFPMPFSAGARLTLTNEGFSPVGAVWYHVDYETFDALPGNVGRFHAQYRQEKTTTATGPEVNFDVCSGEGKNLDGAENYVILDAKGRGNLAGYFLNVYNFSHTWYGEGDDMIFIDGDTWPPSFHGTGSEEIFGGGACPNVSYCGPYTGFHRIDNQDFHGTTSVYRSYVPDPIRFQESIKVTIEHGHNNNFNNDYSSVAFWYQTEPHVPFTPLPVLKDRQAPEVRRTFNGPPTPENGILLKANAENARRTTGWHPYSWSYDRNYPGYWAPKGDGNETFRWNLVGVAPGTYKVLVWVPPNPNNDHAADAPYRIGHAGGTQEMPVDLTKDVANWRELGAFAIDAQSYVELSNRAGGNVTADGILLVPVEK